MRTIHGTLKRLLCALYYRYRTCCVVHAGRRCAPSCVDADKTWSITGALGVMAAALPARAGLGYLLTELCGRRRVTAHVALDRVGISPRVGSHRAPRRSHRLQPDRRLHSMCGRRPSGDAFASIFDASNPAELGSSLLASSSLPRSSVCTRWWWWPHGSR